MNLVGDTSMFRKETWRKSSRSANNSYCVEVAVTPQAVGVRDTKDRDGGTLAFGRDQWAAFVTMVQNRR